VEKSELVLALYGDSIESMYLVEGIFDALRLHKEGKSVIVLMGTSISNAVVSFLRELKCKACLVLDADAADRQRKHENVLVKYLGRDKVEAIYLRNGDVSSDGLHGSSGLLGYIQNKMR
jgi:DNA primase